MKRRSLLKAAATGAAAAAFAKPAIAQSMPELRWRLTSSYPKSLDTIYGGSEVFAKAVAEATDNKFQIQVFAGGEIVPGLQALDATASGAVEMCQTASSFYVGKDPTFAFGTTVPFGLNSRMQNAWNFYGGAFDLLNQLYRKFNVYGIPAGNTTAQMGGWFRKEIRDVGDLRGLKFRIAGLAGQTFSKLGAVPQQLAGGDIYPALEKGALDAAEWIGPYDDEKLGFHKVAKFYYYPGWWEGGAMIHHFINLDKWNELPAAYKSIVRTASEMVNSNMMAKYDAVNPPALKRLVAQGAQLRAFPPAVLEDCLKASTEVFSEISAKNETFKKLWESMLAFRGDGYLWWQVAEHSYDTFMIRTRAR